MIAVGIDPGTSNPGLAVIERTGGLERWQLRMSPVVTSLDELCNCLRGIYLAIPLQLVRVVSVEALSWLQAASKIEHGNKSYQILRAVGAAQMFSGMCRASFIEVPPQTWRKCIGLPKGASKVAARNMLYKLVDDMPAKLSLNRSDAIAIAIAGAMKARTL